MHAIKIVHHINWMDLTCSATSNIWPVFLVILNFIAKGRPFSVADIHGPVESSYEWNGEPSNPIKKVGNCLSSYQLLNEDSTPWCHWFVTLLINYLVVIQVLKWQISLFLSYSLENNYKTSQFFLSADRFYILQFQYIWSTSMI